MREVPFRCVTAAALAVIVGAALAHADSRGELPREGGAGMSIHQLESKYWSKHGSAWIDPSAASALRASRSASLTREVHGYHPYWMGSSYVSHDWANLTTVAFFSLELDSSGSITDAHGWPWNTLVSTAHQHGVRVIVTATLFSSTAIDALLGSASNRQNAIANLTAAVVAGGADGVNVDFEGVPGSRKQDLVTFLGELQSSLAAEVSDPYLSIATPAVDWNNAFDYDELAARCDHLMIMAYDYHWFGSPTTGPVAPLSGWGTHNVSWTVQDYQTWGALPEKMLLGVPYYGYRWAAASGNPGASTDSAGVALIYDQARSESETHGPMWDSESSTPWYRYEDPGWFQGWFEDSLSLASKYDFVLEQNLAGVGIWALGYDGSRPELWNALAGAFGSGTGAVALPGAPRLWIENAGPNPFHEHARFRYAPAGAGPVRISVLDVAGRRLRTLFEGSVPADPPPIVWDGRDGGGLETAPGVYFVQLESQGRVAISRAVRIR